MMEVIGIQLSTAVVRRSGAGNLTKGNEVFFDLSTWQNSMKHVRKKIIAKMIYHPSFLKDVDQSCSR
jgi:hypothetical protein